MRRSPLLLPLAALGLAACGAGRAAAPLHDAHAASMTEAAPEAAAAAAPRATSAALPATGSQPFPSRPDEPRLTNLRRLTFGGQNAEAYFSADGRRLIFQASLPGGEPCDQIFVMDLDGSGVQRVSTGTGRTTCGYFFPTGDRVLFSSTHHVSPACPPPPDRSRGYVWPLHPYDIFVANPDGTGLRQLTDSPGYDAEATISPDGSRIIFTSDRDGDLELYVMDADGGNVRRLTHEEGYDGGAFFSPDGRRIVYRAHHPTDPAELADYRALLAERLIRPGRVEIWVMDADGSNKRQLTDNGAANFAPFFHPNGRQIIFSSNMDHPGGRDFDLYLINLDGSGLERITHAPGFDSFPMFSPDGRTLVWGSHRGSDRRESDIFIADWNELAPSAANR
jgi:TolB protein